MRILDAAIQYEQPTLSHPTLASGQMTLSCRESSESKLVDLQPSSWVPSEAPYTQLRFTLNNLEAPVLLARLHPLHQLPPRRPLQHLPRVVLHPLRVPCPHRAPCQFRAMHLKTVRSVVLCTPSWHPDLKPSLYSAACPRNPQGAAPSRRSTSR
jgi:hypothetical protein